VLLVGAGLLIRSFQQLLRVDPGFDARNVVTISTQVPASAREPAQRAAVYQTIKEQLLALPGVRQVGAVSRLPMMGSDLTSVLFVEGKTKPGQQGPEVQFRKATPDYFTTMGVPLRAGRFFDDHDGENDPVALVDETTARLVWPGEDPVGKRVKIGVNSAGQPWTTIIGIVGNTHFFGLEAAPSPAFYVPYAASPLSAPILVIRTDRDPTPMLNTLAGTVRTAYKGIPAYNAFPMAALVERSTSQRRFLMLLLTGFALAAVLLAAVGVYGSISHSVAQRTREIGLRIALGATRSSALRLVLVEGLRPAAMGVILGSLAAAGLTRLMQSLLFGVRPLDPAVFATAAGLLASSAALACLVPALRATHVDPVVALREE
jgi:predicted permease